INPYTMLAGHVVPARFAHSPIRPLAGFPSVTLTSECQVMSGHVRFSGVFGSPRPCRAWSGDHALQIASAQHGSRSHRDISLPFRMSQKPTFSIRQNLTDMLISLNGMGNRLLRRGIATADHGVPVWHSGRYIHLTERMLTFGPDLACPIRARWARAYSKCA